VRALKQTTNDIKKMVEKGTRRADYSPWEGKTADSVEDGGPMHTRIYAGSLLSVPEVARREPQMSGRMNAGEGGEVDVS